MIVRKSGNPRIRHAACLLLLTAVAAAIWQSSRPKLVHSATSLHGAYRVEYYEASLLQGVLHGGFKMPAFVRLYRTQPEILMAESEVVDLWMNGELYWYTFLPMNKVRVGRDVVFENIPPECTDCPPLPDSAVMP